MLENLRANTAPKKGKQIFASLPDETFGALAGPNIEEFPMGKHGPLAKSEIFSLTRGRFFATIMGSGFHFI